MGKELTAEAKAGAKAPLGFGGVFKQAVASLKLPEPTDLAGRWAIVTGANAGIGFETARYISSMGGSVILACRSTPKAEAAISKIKELASGKGGALEAWELDLAELDSARRFAARLAESGRKVDWLVLNAGAIHLDKTFTADGFEMMYQINYLTHFLLTVLIVPSLAPNAVVTAVSSYGAYEQPFATETINGEDLPPSPWGGRAKVGVGLKRYSQTKLYQVLFTDELQKRLAASETHKGVGVGAVHPGQVASDITHAEHYRLPGFIISLVEFTMKHIARTPLQGATTTLFATLSPDGIQSHRGQFWADSAVWKSPTDEARFTSEVKETFWARSCKDAGLPVVQEWERNSTASEV